MSNISSKQIWVELLGRELYVFKEFLSHPVLEESIVEQNPYLGRSIKCVSSQAT